MNSTKITVPGLDDYYIQESMKVLRTNIQFCGKDVKTIAVTSYTMNEGKSSLSLHIGISLSELGKKVLVIDADMRKSVLAGRNSSATNVKGLSEVLTGISGISETLYSTQYPNLHLLFAGQYPPNPVELLSGKYFTELIENAQKVYDYIIIDTPPLGLVIDAAVIAANCDSAIYVIGNTKTRYTQGQYVVEQLKKSGCNVLGAVLFNTNNKYYKGQSYGKYKYEYK